MPSTNISSRPSGEFPVITACSTMPAQMTVQASSGARRRSASGAPISTGQTTLSQAGPANAVLITLTDHTATAVIITPMTPRLRSSARARPAAFMPLKVQPPKDVPHRPRGWRDSSLRPNCFALTAADWRRPRAYSRDHLNTEGAFHETRTTARHGCSSLTDPGTAAGTGGGLRLAAAARRRAPAYRG